MCRKFLLASHERMAEGLKHTLEFIGANGIQIDYLNAYVDDKPFVEELHKYFKEQSDEDEIFVFTDVAFGSVNQEAIKLLEYRQFHLITGMNLPLLLGMAFAPADHRLADIEIEEYLQQAREGIVYMNTVNVEKSEDDEL